MKLKDIAYQGVLLDVRIVQECCSHLVHFHLEIEGKSEAHDSILWISTISTWFPFTLFKQSLKEATELAAQYRLSSALGLKTWVN